MKYAIKQLMKLIQSVPNTNHTDHPNNTDTAHTATTTSPLRQYTAQSPSQKRGAFAEQLAQNYLETQGLILIDRNVASNLGEIDLIMRDADTYVFVEVKARTSTHFGGAHAAITPHKLSKLKRAIELYLQNHPEAASSPCRVDAILIQSTAAKTTTHPTASSTSAEPKSNPRIEWIQNIELD